MKPLLPCPFCGGKSELRFEGSPLERDSCRIVCTKCECATPLFYKKLSWCAIDKAIETWNTRTKSPLQKCDDCIHSDCAVNDDPCCSCSHMYESYYIPSRKEESEQE